jgi:DMSO reductase anchor subunit
MDDQFHALSVFASAFGAASFAGLATLLRFARKLSKLSIVSAMLNSGVLGLAIALIWYQNYREAQNVYGLIGICVMAGMGGSTLTDLLISLLSGAGIKVTIIHERDRDGDYTS